MMGWLRMRWTMTSFRRRMTGAKVSSRLIRFFRSSLGMMVSTVFLVARAEAMRGSESISAISPITLPSLTWSMGTSRSPVMHDISTSPDLIRQVSSPVSPS